MTDALVVVAMAEEAEPFLARADRVGATAAIAHAEATDVVVGGRSVLLVRSGIGSVAASVALAVALHERGPVPVISAGSAGGLAPDVRVGDVVVGARYRFAGADATAFGYRIGQIPGMPETFEGASALVDAARRAHLPDALVRVGEMVSGDSFVDARTVEAVRRAVPEALSTDMETTALAQTCHLLGVPFVSVRGISDLCGPVAGSDFATHVDDAADRSASVVIEALTAVRG